MSVTKRTGRETSRPYVGVIVSEDSRVEERRMFRATQTNYGERSAGFASVIGPFKTALAANYTAASGSRGLAIRALEREARVVNGLPVRIRNG